MHDREGSRWRRVFAGQWNAHASLRGSRRQPRIHSGHWSSYCYVLVDRDGVVTSSCNLQCLGRVRSVHICPDWHWQNKTGGEGQPHVKVRSKQLHCCDNIQYWRSSAGGSRSWWPSCRWAGPGRSSSPSSGRGTSSRLCSRFVMTLNYHQRFAYSNVTFCCSIFCVRTDQRPVIATFHTWTFYVTCIKRSGRCWTRTRVIGKPYSAFHNMTWVRMRMFVHSVKCKSKIYNI